MAGKYIQASIKPSRRVQIVRTDDKGPSAYWKPGQFGFAVSYSTHPGMYTEKGPSAPDELSYLVSKSRDGHTGSSWFSAEGLRFTGKTTAPRPDHSRKKKISPLEAKQLIQSDGIDFNQDFHQLRSSEVQRVLEVAKLAGYRKSKNAPGSTARMYFQYLSRLKSHATKKTTHTVYDLVEVNKKTKKDRVIHEHFSSRADANEAADEYRDRKRPDLSYKVRSRDVASPMHRWNLED